MSLTSPVCLLQQQGSFSQLPLPMQITFILVALGSAYAVWVLVLRDRVSQPRRVTPRDAARLDGLARDAGLGAPLPDAPFILDRINVTHASDEIERAYSAVKCYERGVAVVSLSHQQWQAEAAIAYADLDAAQAYAEYDLTGLRAAILGPFAFLIQKKQHFIGVVSRSGDGLARSFLFHGKKSVIETFSDFLSARKPVREAVPELVGSGV